MEIKLKKAFIKENEEELKKKPWEIETNWRYGGDEVIDLRHYTKDNIDKLLEIIRTSKSPGRKALEQDILNYIHMDENKDAVKEIRARTVRHAESLLINYFQKYSKKKWVFERLVDEEVTVAYYVERIKYHEAEREKGGWYTPEFISMRLAYIEMNELESTTVSISVAQCLGRNVKEILRAIGLMYDRPSLQEDYKSYLEKWTELHDSIGKQMLSVGSGDCNGIDGNSKTTRYEDDDWWSNKSTSVDFAKYGEPSRVLIDTFKEKETKNRSKIKDKMPDPWFWRSTKSIVKTNSKKQVQEAEWDESKELTEQFVVDVPIHPYVVVFDIARHLRLRTHIGNLTEYTYDESIRDKLVLPETSAKLIDVLLTESNTDFKDIVKGKTGGMIIICQGPPGTGKTLTAEVYAESMKRPLYTVQCAQLGTDPEGLEENLMKILARGKRWNAVTLLDEADVYVHERGNDLAQNAIVGVFLRVLEYHAGVLFLTTNRGDLVDDAILSRCTARIPYGVPELTEQHRIWKVLSEANNISLSKQTIRSIVDAHPKLSGRDIKNLLKLASLVAKDRGVEIDAELIGEMKIFKPTFTSIKEKD